MKTVAFIAAKGQSQRFPGKNVAPLAGVPLIVHTVKMAYEAKALGLIDRVVVSVDAFEPVGRTLSMHGYDNCWEYQPDDIKAARPPVIQVLRRWLEDQHPADLPGAVCVLWPTSPFREVRHLVESFRLLEPSVDAVLSMTACRENPRTTCVRDPDGTLRLWHPGQLRETGYEYARHNGVVIWAWTAWLLRATEFYDSHRLRPYMMPVDAAVDIDVSADLMYAEYLLSRRATA